MDNQISIPKNVFDKEYSTQWKREVKFLEEKGINYTYAKKHYRYPIIRYKYAKTPELFLALAEFYKQVYIENIHKKIDQANAELLPVEKGYIEVNASELTSAEKKTVGFQVEGQEIENLIKDDTE